MLVYYTPQEAADILKVSYRTITGWVKEGKLRASMIGSSKVMRITKEAIEEFIANSEIKKQ